MTARPLTPGDPRLTAQVPRDPRTLAGRLTARQRRQAALNQQLIVGTRRAER